jgi:preprotein translocase subunit SecG
MIYLLTVIHVVVCFVLIGIILLQPGTGADLAGAFGGQGSQTAFGPRGTVSVLTKVTTWCAIIFAITSIGLTVIVTRGTSGHSVLHGLQSVPAQTRTHQAPASPRR